MADQQLPKDLESYLLISEKVQKALSTGGPVVALESTIISHGMPYPRNVQVARRVEEILESQAVVPATIAMLNGRICIGLSHEQMEYLGKSGKALRKVGTSKTCIYSTVFY